MERERPRLLLIEDNEDDVALTTRALRQIRAKAELLFAADGAAALERLFAAEAVLPDLVLLDLKLPFMDGLEILRRIRSAPRTTAVPVVVLTTSLEERDLREAYLRGANSYLRKPVDFTEFVALLRETLHYWLELNNVPSSPEEDSVDA